jgi:hypothetical protein
MDEEDDEEDINEREPSPEAVTRKIDTGKKILNAEEDGGEVPSL